MNALTIAGKEFDDAVRSRSLWAAGVVLVGALVAVTAGYAVVSPRPTTPTLVAYLVALTKWLVPVTALVAGYDAVVGERTAGTMRLLFGFPYTRGQVLLGKAIGRFAAVIAPVTVGLLASFLLSVALYPRPAPREYAILLGTTALLAAAFVGLAVAASTLSRSSSAPSSSSCSCGTSSPRPSMWSSPGTSSVRGRRRDGTCCSSASTPLRVSSPSSAGPSRRSRRGRPPARRRTSIGGPPSCC